MVTSKETPPDYKAIYSMTFNEISNVLEEAESLKLAVQGVILHLKTIQQEIEYIAISAEGEE